MGAHERHIDNLNEKIALLTAENAALSEMVGDVLDAGPNMRAVVRKTVLDNDRLTDDLADARKLIDKLKYIKYCADNGVALFVAQGQALDGYSELAEYRAAIASWEDKPCPGQ